MTLAKPEFEQKVFEIQSLLNKLKETRQTLEDAEPLTEEEEKVLSEITSKIDLLRPQISDHEEQKDKLNLLENDLTKYVIGLIDPVLPIVEEKTSELEKNQQDFNSQTSDLKEIINKLNESFQNYLSIRETSDEFGISMAEEKITSEITNLKNELKDLDENTEELIQRHHGELKKLRHLVSNIIKPFNEATLKSEPFKKIFAVGSQFEEKYNNLIKSRKNNEIEKLFVEINTIKERLKLSQTELKATKIKQEANQILLKIKPKFQLLEEKLKEINKEVADISKEGTITDFQSKPEYEIEMFQEKSVDLFKELKDQIESSKNNWESLQKELPFSPGSEIWDELQKKIKPTKSKIEELKSYQDEAETAIHQFQEKIKEIEKELENARKTKPLVIRCRDINESINKDLSSFQIQFDELKNALTETEKPIPSDTELKKVLARLNEFGEKVKKSVKKHQKDYNDFQNIVKKGELNIVGIIGKESASLADSIFRLEKDTHFIEKQIKTLRNKIEWLQGSHEILLLEKKVEEYHDKIERAKSDFEDVVRTILSEESLFTKKLLNFSDTEFHKIQENLKTHFEKLIASQNTLQEEIKVLEASLKDLPSRQVVKNEKQRELENDFNNLNKELSDLEQLISKIKSSAIMSSFYREEQLTKQIAQLKTDFSKNILAIKTRLPSSFMTSFDINDEKLVEMNADTFEIFLNRLEVMKPQCDLIEENLEKALSHINEFDKMIDLLNSEEHKDLKARIEEWRSQLYSERDKTSTWWNEKRSTIRKKLNPVYWRVRQEEALKLKQEIDAWDTLIQKTDNLIHEYQEETKKLKEISDESEAEWENRKIQTLSLGEKNLESIEKIIEDIESFQKDHQGWLETTIRNYVDALRSQRDVILSGIESIKNLKLAQLQSQAPSTGVADISSVLPPSAEIEMGYYPSEKQKIKVRALSGKIIGGIIGGVTGVLVSTLTFAFFAALLGSILPAALMVIPIIPITMLVGIGIGHISDRQSEKKLQETIDMKKYEQPSGKDKDYKYEQTKPAKLMKEYFTEKKEEAPPPKKESGTEAIKKTAGIAKERKEAISLNDKDKQRPNVKKN